MTAKVSPAHKAAERFVTLSSPIGPVEAWLTYEWREEEDGTRIYFQREERDCMRAALATLLQIDYEEVPAWRGDGPISRAEELQGWLELSQWAAEHGYRMRAADQPPSGEEKPSFLGLTPPGPDHFRHVIAVREGRIYDPAAGFRLPVGFEREPQQTIGFILMFEEQGA